MENMENNVVEAVDEVKDLVTEIPEIETKSKVNVGAIAVIAGVVVTAGAGIAAAWRHHKKVKAKKQAAAEDDLEIEDLNDEDYFDDLDDEDQADSEENSKEKTE